MTKPAFCKKHNVQSFILTTPRLAEAIEHREYLKMNEIVTLKILSCEKIFEYKIDDMFVTEFNFNPVGGVVILHDRDKTVKKKNDRLLIQKVTSAMKWVCQLCLSEVLKKASKE